MKHPGEMQLHLYGDGELDKETHHRVEAHLDQCASCRAVQQGWKQLGALVRETQPEMSAFRSEGAFWSQLAGRLPRAHSPVWPWVPYLPPFLLGMLGTAIGLLSSALFTLRALVGLGVIAPVGPSILGWLSSFLAGTIRANTGLENALTLLRSSLASLDLPGSELAKRGLQQWASTDWFRQDTVFLFVILFILWVLFFIIVAIYWSWVACWMKPARPHRNGGK